MDDQNIAPDSSDDAVGYRKPPKAHRFPKGKSGNPRGRPRKQPVTSMLDMVQQLLDEEITLGIGGTPTRKTRREFMALRAVNDLLAGKKGAAKALDNLIKLPVMKMKAPDNGRYITFRLDQEAVLPALEFLERHKDIVE